MHHGRLVEEGNHEGLLAAGGLYRRLHELQFTEAAGLTLSLVPRVLRPGVDAGPNLFGEAAYSRADFGPHLRVPFQKAGA